jgi:hypothetical protein
VDAWKSMVDPGGEKRVRTSLTTQNRVRSLKGILDASVENCPHMIYIYAVNPLAQVPSS